MGTRTARAAAIAAIVVLAGTVALAHAAGGGPRVYVADGQSCSVAAYADTMPTFVAPQDFCFVEGMSLTAGGQILVADTQAGVYRIDPETSEAVAVDTSPVYPSDVYPDCLSGDIYYISYNYRALFVVLEGSTSPGQFCISFDSEPLDLQVYPTGERAGHVLVLLRGGETPPYLAEFNRTGPTTFEELPPVVGEATSNAVGFAIRPNGGIVLLDNVTGMYNVGPEGELTHFGPSCGLYGTDIDIGADGTIYVTDSEVNRTHRFDPAGYWILPSLNTIVESPRAVAAVGFTPSPPGGNVPVTPVQGVELLFEEITTGGYTSATTAETMSRVSPGGNTLPEYASSPDGREGFTYVSLATTAVHENLVQVDVLLPGSRLFFAHGSGETFRDVTVEGTIEDARGVISRFSEVVVVDDTRPLAAVIDDKFARLLEILSPNLAARRAAVESAKKVLRQHAVLAQRLYVSGLTEAAIDELADLNDDARLFAGVAIPNSSASPGGNLAGEILSRSKTLMFSLGLLAGRRDTALERPAGPGLSLVCASPSTGDSRMELVGPVGAHVTARLYTVGGRLVRTLFDGALSSGRETLVWDGTDDSSRRVASGVYMTRVESGESLATGKVVFIR